MDPAKILERVLDEPRVAMVRSVLDIYGAAAGGLLANGLAFSSLFAAIPTTLLVIGVAGWLTDDLAVRASVAEALAEAFPPLADLIDGSLEAMSAGAAVTSIFGVVGLIWTVSQLYGALDVAFARIFAVDAERDIVRRTARGFLVVAILVVAIVGFIVLSTVSAAVDAIAPGIPLVGELSGVAGSLPFLMALAIVAVVIVYRTLPPVAPAWRSLVVPAIAVGIIVVVLSQVFTFLVPRLVGVAALAGSLASAFIALAWLSFTYQAMLYGAAWVRVRDEARSDRGSAGLGSPAASAEPGSGGQ
jgi:YihY family inner membrane protein